MKVQLRKRELELQKIIRQMRRDKLEASPVYRNLESELASLKGQLTAAQNDQ